MKYKQEWAVLEKCLLQNCMMLFRILFVLQKHLVVVLCQQVQLWRKKKCSKVGLKIRLCIQQHLVEIHLACAAAIATIHVLIGREITGTSCGSWGVFLEWIETSGKGHEDKVFEIRGQGLMIGIEFHKDEIGYEVSKGMFDQGVLVAGTLINSKTIRIEPSLTISYEEVDTVINTFKSVLTQVKVK